MVIEEGKNFNKRLLEDMVAMKLVKKYKNSTSETGKMTYLS